MALALAATTVLMLSGHATDIVLRSRDGVPESLWWWVSALLVAAAALVIFCVMPQSAMTPVVNAACIALGIISALVPAVTFAGFLLTMLEPEHLSIYLVSLLVAVAPMMITLITWNSIERARSRSAFKRTFLGVVIVTFLVTATLLAVHGTRALVATA